MTEFRSKIVKGISWNVLARVGQQVLKFGFDVALARILSPGEVGLITKVLVFSNLAAIFEDFGFSAAVIQKKDLKQIHLSSVFWLNAVLGLACTLLLIGAAPLISSFYHDPMAGRLTLFVALNCVISSLTIVQKSVFVKAINFKSISLSTIAATVLSGVFAVGAALYGCGVWSLVVQSVGFYLFLTFFFWTMSKWRPAFIFSISAVREIFVQSASYFGTNIMIYVLRNIDYLLIGKYLGNVPLGLYANAYKIMLIPLTNMSGVITQVMFPAMSQIQEDKERVKALYLKIIRVVTLSVAPLMFGLYATAHPFVLTVFGAKWKDMAPLLEIFAFTGLVQSIGSHNGTVFLSQGRADLQFIVGLPIRIFSILSIIVGLRWGVVGVSWACLISSIVSIFPQQYYAGKLINCSSFDFIRTMTGSIACSAAMAGVVKFIDTLMPSSFPPFVVLGIEIIVGGITFVALALGFKLQAISDLKEFTSSYSQVKIERAARKDLNK